MSKKSEHLADHEKDRITDLFSVILTEMPRVKGHWSLRSHFMPERRDQLAVYVFRDAEETLNSWTAQILIYWKSFMKTRRAGRLAAQAIELAIAACMKPLKPDENWFDPCAEILEVDGRLRLVTRQLEPASS